MRAAIFFQERPSGLRRVARQAGMRFRRGALTGLAAAAFASGLLLFAVSAGAISTPDGTKNFTPPAAAPDYFSGEGGAFRGAAPAVRPVAPAIVAPAVAAPAPRNEGAQEQRYMTRRSYTTTAPTTRVSEPVRRWRAHVARREVEVVTRNRRVREEAHRGFRAARGRVEARRAGSARARPAVAHHVATASHRRAEAAPRGRRLARAGR